MTRWLQAAQGAIEAGNLPKKPKQPAEAEVNSVNSVNSGGGSALSPEELALDHFEERAAIREFSGGQDRAEAEAAALVEASEASGIAVERLRILADRERHPDSWR